MQVSVFVSVNYNREASEEDIIAYVQDNVDIYSLNYGENVQWQRSTIDNGYHHDIDHATNRNVSRPPKMISDVRALLYFTVPACTAEGEHRWIAKLDGKQTNDDTPLTITVKSFHVSKGDLILANKKDTSIHCNLMYVLKYNDDVLPDAQKLVKLVEYKGMKFFGSGGNSWVSMSKSTKGHKLGVFVEYGVTSNIKIANSGDQHLPDQMEKHDLGENSGVYNKVVCSCLDNTLEFDPYYIKEAWNEGILMVQVRDWSVRLYRQFYGDYRWYDYDYLMNDFVIEDTFGCRMKVGINWDVGDYWGFWAVSSVTVVYP
uniref:Uncharacterized protein n=1 Tax=Amphimedon queenslandica TaxID=400682 RepID=A0A1X7ULI5_AMPQE